MHCSLTSGKPFHPSIIIPAQLHLLFCTALIVLCSYSCLCISAQECHHSEHMHITVSRNAPHTVTMFQQRGLTPVHSSRSSTVVSQESESSHFAVSYTEKGVLQHLCLSCRHAAGHGRLRLLRVSRSDLKGYSPDIESFPKRQASDQGLILPGHRMKSNRCRTRLSPDLDRHQLTPIGTITDTLDLASKSISNLYE